MTRQVTLRIIIGENPDPDVTVAMALLTALADRPESGVCIEQHQETSLLGIEEVVAFMAAYLPDGTPINRIRERARQFYAKLVHWSCNRLPLRFSCRFCFREYGNCRCIRMGWDERYQTYGEGMAYLAAWLLDPQSVKDLTDIQIASIHANTARQLAAFRTHLTN